MGRTATSRTRLRPPTRLLLCMSLAWILACDASGVETRSAETPSNGEGAWRIDEDFRLGESEEAGPELFGEIRSMAVDGNGSILVFDGLANELRRFSADGEHEWTMGRAGEGPGEFLLVLGVGVSPKGDAWVVDARNARFTVVDPRGGTRTLPRTSRWAIPPWIGGFGPDGRLHELATVQGARPEGLVDLLLAVDGEGAVTSEHPIPRDQPPRPTVGMGIVTSLPFEPVVLWAWDPSGAIWQALSSEYRIFRIDLQGDTTAVVAQETPGLPLSAPERDSLQAGIRRAERMGATVESGMIPQALPPLRWFTVDDEGRLWVCASGRDPCRELDLFDRTGRKVGVVRLPVDILELPRPVICNGRFHAAVHGPQGEPQRLVGRVVR